jgi:Tol biopolymer transport system component
MNADGGGLRRLGRGGGQLSWSPDGTRIVFDNTGDISVVNPDATGLRGLGEGFRPT